MTQAQDTATLKLGLIGDNIAKSRAPRLHELIGTYHGIPTTYERLVPREMAMGFDDVFAHAARGYRGINVTYPYKELAARKVTVDDPLVAAIGAVNTVLFEPAGPKGFNTDFSGFKAAYREVRGAAGPGAVCMIGTGGVGRAVAFGLLGLGASELRLVDRDRAKAEALAADLRTAAPEARITVSDTAEAGSTGAAGIINCTPVGMLGYEGTPLPRAAMTGADWLFDAVYTPVDTRFLRDAEAEGLTVISGYELFFWQGVHASRLFTGRAPDEARLRADLQAEA